MNIFMSKYEALELDHVALAATVAEDALRYPSAVLTGRAYGVGPVLARLYAVYTGPRTPAQKKSLLQGGGLGLFFLIIYSAYALAFWYGGNHLIANGEIESGTVMTCIFSVLMGAFGLAMLAPNLQAITFALTAAGKILAVTKRVRPKIDATNPRGRTVDPADCMGHIEFDQVDFTYPAVLDRPALKNVSVTFPAGTRTVLVGPDGSGKSTLAQLISRFYDPDLGCVRFDNMDLRDVNVRWLRQRIGVVQPHAILFPGVTIAANIAFGLDLTLADNQSPEQVQRKVEQAAQLANAHAFIMALPHGYETVVAAPPGTPGLLPPPVPGSVHLTSSERQRLAIARAIVHDPVVIILDEATTAMDASATQEQKEELTLVQHTIDAISHNRTAISIVHRLRLAEAGGGGTLERADNIIVMARGSVVEKGTHAELMELQGEYTRLIEAQQIRDRVRSWRHNGAIDAACDAHDRLSLADSHSTRPGTPELKAIDTVHHPHIYDGTASSPPPLDVVSSPSKPQRTSRGSHRAMLTIGSRPVVPPAQQLPPFKTRLWVRLRRFPFLHRPRHESALYLLYRLAMVNKDRLIYLFLPGLVAAACSGCAYPAYSILFGRSLHNFSTCTPMIVSVSGATYVFSTHESARLPHACPEPFRHQMKHQAQLNALYFFIVAIVAGIAILVQTHNLMLNAAITIERVRAQCLSKLLGADISYFDNPSDTPSSFPDASGRDVRAATRVPSFINSTPAPTSTLSYAGAVSGTAGTTGSVGAGGAESDAHAPGGGEAEYALTHASGLTDAANKLTGLVGATLGTIVQSVATLVAGYIIALIYSPRMAGVCIACTPLLLSAGACRLLVVVLKDGAIKRAHLRSAIQSGLFFAVAGPDGDVVRLVHSLQLQHTVLKSYEQALSTSKHGTRLGGMSPAAVVYHIVGWGNGVYALSQSLAFLVLSLGFWYGSRMLEHGHITVERFFTVLTAVIFGSIQAGNVFNFAPDIEVARRAGAQIFRLLDRRNKIEPNQSKDDNPDPQDARHLAVGKEASKYLDEPLVATDGPPGAGVTFRDVTFHHPAVPLAPALLQRLNVDVRPGSYVAVISAGAGGSASHNAQAYLRDLKLQAVANGAHALMSLIERFYAADESSSVGSGLVELDGVDVSNLPPQEMRKCMSILAPDTRWTRGWGAPGVGGTLFEGTIGWNIRLGAAALRWSPQSKADAVDLNVSNAEARQAAEEAKCLEWIDKLPDGMETWISPNPNEASEASQEPLSRVTSLASTSGGAGTTGSFGASSSSGAGNSPHHSRDDQHGRVLVLPPHQRQQIALARALVRRPRLLLLDEPTLGLEPEHQASLQAILDEVALAPLHPASPSGSGEPESRPADPQPSSDATSRLRTRPTQRKRTTIAVAHVNASASGSRAGPSVAAVATQADEVIVLHDGLVVERGTPAELAARQGLYSTIIRLQALHALAPR